MEVIPSRKISISIGDRHKAPFAGFVDPLLARPQLGNAADRVSRLLINPASVCCVHAGSVTDPEFGANRNNIQRGLKVQRHYFDGLRLERRAQEVFHCSSASIS
jgi:hypothetical protein